MKLLIVLFISSLLVFSIACGSQNDELVKEVQLLREEVNELKCHKHYHSAYETGGNPAKRSESVIWMYSDIFHCGALGK